MKVRLLTLVATMLALTVLRPALAEDAPAAPAAEAKDKAAKPPPKKQKEVASATATFAKVAKTEEGYTAAVDAHDIEGARKKDGTEGAFKGVVSGIYERFGLLIVNFDKDYKKALCAAMKGKSFAEFPDMQSIVGKEIVVSGKFTLHNDRPEIVIEKPEQIKLVAE